MIKLNFLNIMEQYQNYINGQFKDSKKNFIQLILQQKRPWAEISAAAQKKM